MGGILGESTEQSEVLLGESTEQSEVKCEASVERSEKLLEESTERSEVYPSFSPPLNRSASRDSGEKGFAYSAFAAVSAVSVFGDSKGQSPFVLKINRLCRFWYFYFGLYMKVT